MAPSDEQSNYETFRDCLAEPVVRKLAVKPAKPPRKRGARGRKNHPKTEPTASEEAAARGGGEESSDAEELAEFVDYLAAEIFPSLPPDLRSLSYSTYSKDAALQSQYSDPISIATLDEIGGVLPPSISDSLVSYGLLPEDITLSGFLSPILTAYIASAAAPPPVWKSTRTAACEICERDWVNLSYHHLIPREAHEKVLKRGWHEEWELNSVAWLCRGCHSFVHHVESNEELAKNWYTVELLKTRQDVQKFAAWMGRVRWKKR